MPEVVNTSFLGSEALSQDESSKKTMIKVEHVSMVFNMASETMTNLKEYAIALMRRELRFKEFRALDDISLEVKQGDVYGILGTNGSGKSTLLKIVAGVLDPTEGTCEIFGNIAPLIELGAGFDMELTARENIYLNGALLGYSKEFINEHFDEIVNFAEISRFLDMPLKNYSSGMVARIAFAIATVVIPDILIVDEVLSVGDTMFQKKCERRINSLIKDHGVTVLIVSHDTNLVERLCNKAVWIEKGHMRMLGSAEKVCETYRVLGGHTGSSESEKRVFDLIRETDPKNLAGSQTFMGDNRYSVSVKIFDQLTENQKVDQVVIAPGENPAVCMLANVYASISNTPILLTQKDRLPDLVSQKLSLVKPKTCLFLGGEEFISSNVIEQVHTVSPTSSLHVFSGNSEECLASELYQTYKNNCSSKKAILTYREGIGDLLCFLPYVCNQHVPIFFSIDNGKIGQEVIDELTSGAFDEILLLGGQTSFPDSCLIPFENKLRITRFCGKDSFDANNLILDWTKNNSDLLNKSFEAFLISIWNPEDALSVGPLLCKRNGIVLVEDAQDLDSIANVLDFIVEHPTNLIELVFFGDETQFSDVKKALLLTELRRVRNKYDKGAVHE